MFAALKQRIYYLIHGETENERDTRQAALTKLQSEQAKLQAERDARDAQLKEKEREDRRRTSNANKSRKIAWKAQRDAEQLEKIAKERAKELAYQKFLETNKVTVCEETLPDSIEEALERERELRRQATRRAKEFDDARGD